MCWLRTRFFPLLLAVCLICPVLPGGSLKSDAYTRPPASLHPAESPRLYTSVMIFRFQHKEWIFPLSEIGFDGVDPTTLNRQAFMNWFSLVVEHEINRPARSARFDRQRRIIPHQLGRKVDRQKVYEWLDSIHEYLGRPLEVPVIWIQPQLTTKKLQQLKQKKLSSYSTYFNARNLNRTHNIRLSVQAIDHTVLLPGQIFSFNRIVGERSLARGYRPARIIVKGEYSEGIGGGICQTSSTLFNSVDRAGLRVIQRVSHSKMVTYVPKYRDATVSWGGPDFRFQNQLNEPILIEAEIQRGRLTISIYGPKNVHYYPRSIPPAPHQGTFLEE
ncbi:VanW family protein [Thermoactinomyces daqus]|uniref:VanW family protein n=1 Tax=Thermoactinomyces daqus TaxID=1329516 RepID=A0A7W1XC53_9BACL|nr:VanW family protein [Thermoactinomyces daqus]MBA4543949.1 VanW family protein [Thermoactinomyces daqus]